MIRMDVMSVRLGIKRAHIAVQQVWLVENFRQRLQLGGGRGAQRTDQANLLLRRPGTDAVSSQIFDHFAD